MKQEKPKMSAIDLPTIKSLVEERFNALKHTSLAALLILPDCTEETVTVSGKNVQLFTIHAIMENKHCFVLQAMQQRWGGIFTKIIVRGFELLNDGQIRDLVPEELYEFT